ncbi:MAG: enoyl-CoA hydratase/isomerase family protein [Gemmatimonadetes bacterium]|nr:enoyl-CoA hydratase/isomerase family protein [Gemmatimonadota bacterium]
MARDTAPIITITLGTPEQPCWLDHATLDVIEAGLTTARGDARAIVLRGSRNAFCLGMASPEHPEPGALQAGINRFVEVLEGLRNGPLPVIAVVEGPVRGGGLALLAVADVVIATPAASCQLPELFLGLVPGVVGAYLVPARLSEGRMRYLAQSGATRTAEDACQDGLFDEVVAADALERRLRELLRQVGRASQRALQRGRRLLASGPATGRARRVRQGAAELVSLACGSTTTEHQLDAPVGHASDRPTPPVTWSVIEPGIAQVTMCDAASGNALSAPMLAGLRAALAEVSRCESLSVCILAGTPSVFSSGATAETLHHAAAGRVDLAEVELAGVVLDADVPVVAAVEGHAVGGGLVLAAACDVTILASESRYGATFTRLGITPGMGCTALLEELVGPGLAREMMYTGRTWRGADLLRRGVPGVRVLPRADVLTAALDLARDMCGSTPRVSRLLKQTLAVSRRERVDAALALERAAHRDILEHPETAQVILARVPVAEPLA